MNTKQECIAWCESFLEGRFGVRPNMEDCNYFRSIISHLSENDAISHLSENDAEPCTGIYVPDNNVAYCMEVWKT